MIREKEKIDRIKENCQKPQLYTINQFTARSRSGRKGGARLGSQQFQCRVGQEGRKSE